MFTALGGALLLGAIAEQDTVRSLVATGPVPARAQD